MSYDEAITDLSLIYTPRFCSTHPSVLLRVLFGAGVLRHAVWFPGESTNGVKWNRFNNVIKVTKEYLTTDLCYSCTGNTSGNHSVEEIGEWILRVGGEVWILESGGWVNRSNNSHSQIDTVAFSATMCYGHESYGTDILSRTSSSCLCFNV